MNAENDDFRNRLKMSEDAQSSAERSIATLDASTKSLAQQLMEEKQKHADELSERESTIRQLQERVRIVSCSSFLLDLHAKIVLTFFSSRCMWHIHTCRPRNLSDYRLSSTVVDLDISDLEGQRSQDASFRHREEARPDPTQMLLLLLLCAAYSSLDD